MGLLSWEIWSDDDERPEIESCVSMATVTILYTRTHTHTDTHYNPTFLAENSHSPTPTRPSYWYIPFASSFSSSSSSGPSFHPSTAFSSSQKERGRNRYKGRGKKKTIKNIEWLETWKNVWLVISLRFVKYLPPHWRKKNGNGRHMEVSPSAVCTYA